MASDDDIDIAMHSLGRANRPVRAGRLPSFLGGDSSERPVKAAPKEKGATTQKPREAKEGFSQIGTGNQVTFDQWIGKLNKVMPFLGAGLAMKSQLVAAEAVAGMLRHYLAEGVDPAPSGMTIGLNNNFIGPKDELSARRDAGASLATLGRHLIVEKPKQLRAGIRAGKANSTRFTKGFSPCIIRFENDKWDRIAYTLEHGRVWLPPEKLRRALFFKSIHGGFVPNLDKKGAWSTPARPFSHILTGREAQRIVQETATAALAGNLRKKQAEWKEKYEDSHDHAKSNIDDLADVLQADDGEDDWTDLVTFGKRKRR